LRYLTENAMYFRPPIGLFGKFVVESEGEHKDLLKIANSQNIPALMLTAQASTDENLYRLCEAGAAYYVHKNKMHDLDTFLADVFQAIEEGKNSWDRGLERLCISLTLKSEGDVQ